MSHVALLHYSAPPIVGGVESILGQHARLMATDRHQVQVVAGRGEQTDPRITFVPLPLADSRHPEVMSIKAELDEGRVPPKFGELVERLTSQLTDALRGVDILIAHNVCSLNKNLALTAAVRNLANRSRPRVILWHHDLAWTTGRYRAELHDGHPWDLLRQAWPGVRQVTISAMRQEELAKLFGLHPDDITVVPNGVDIARFLKLEGQSIDLVDKLELLEAAPLLLLPVRITPRKNIELALRVCASLKQYFLETKLVVTGPLGPHNPANLHYFEKLVAMRQTLGLEKDIYFLAEHAQQYLPDEVISDFFRLADVLFLPSREEGFGIPVLEAGLAGLRIFCSDIPPLRSLGGTNATYFSADADPDEIAASMADALCLDPRFRLRSEVRSDYSWGRIYTQHIAPLLLK